MAIEQIRMILIIALCVVSFLLWDAWQRDYGPRPPPPASTEQPAPDAPSRQPAPQSGDVPQAPRRSGRNPPPHRRRSARWPSTRPPGLLRAAAFG